MKKRAVSLDVLRGLAIVGMVLSATIGGGLPAWMHHAQEPPPTFAYDSQISGITWVDLVFPLFLFAMGAAFPMSVGKRLSRGESRRSVAADILKRGVKLAFFSVYVQHFYPYMLCPDGGWYAWGWAIVAFLLLFPMFMRIPYAVSDRVKQLIKLSAYTAGVVLLLCVKDAGDVPFTPTVNNPILLILAYMAVLGGLSYLFTARDRRTRMLIIVLVAALSAGTTVEGSWQQNLNAWCPLPGLYQFDYVKYLLIVLPGSFAGEWLLEWTSLSEGSCKVSGADKLVDSVMLIVALALAVCNVTCLYLHLDLLNICLSLLLIVTGNIALRFGTDTDMLKRRLWQLASLLLALGLLLQPLQGGVKKDPPTLGYLFVTAAIGCAMLLVFHVLCDRWNVERPLCFMSMSGQNPMVAYVACDLLIMPVLNILGLLSPLFAFFAQNAWLGLLQGIFLTSLTIGVTMFFSRIHWYWRT